MVLRPRLASLSLLLLCACAGDPLEADSGTATGSSSSGSDASATMTGNSTLTATGGMSATIASDSNDSSGSASDPSATSATSATQTSATQTSDTQTSDTQTSDTEGTTTEASTTDATTTDATTETTASEESSTTTGDECVGDEAMLHQTPGSAIDLAGLDCDDAAAAGAGVIDDATWEDWWAFYGSDAGSCEPDMVRVQVTSGGPLRVCAYLEIGCIATCSVGVSDGLGLGCCGDDQVVFSASCGQDDSSLVSIRFGEGSEQCQAFTFSYEF